MRGSLKKMVPGGPKEEEARKVHRKVEIASLKKGAGGDYNGHKSRGKERKGKGKPSEEKNNQPWEPEDRYDDSSLSSAVRRTLAWYGTGHTE